MIRSPICTVVGHIDHGKTTLLDRIRNTKVAKGEAGGITQSISSTKISLEAIKKTCGNLLNAMNINFTIPGILLIDTPGHAAFNNLRKRGGNLADIAILVIDITKGIEEQTIECINILKNYKTPFIIAANKIDLISGWRVNSAPLLQNIQNQSSYVVEELDKRLYTLVGKLSEYGLNSERFDRVDDFTKQIAIVPCSAISGEGVPELLMVIAGLAQKYLENSLKINVEGEGKGVILEVKDEKGFGTTTDVILYDGTLKTGDTIVLGTLEEPLVTKVRGLFEFEGAKLKTTKEVVASTGVRILAPDLKEAVGGMPLRVANKELEKIKEEVKKEVKEVAFETEKEGFVIKADTLGSLEALIFLLKQKELKIKSASIGEITKKDVSEAIAEKEPLNKAILGFNVKKIDNKDVKIICYDVIYKIIEDVDEWRKQEAKKLEAKELEKLIRPFKIQVVNGCIFRQSNPAVVGVRVLGGIVKPNVNLIKQDGSKASYIKSIQVNSENVEQVEKDKEAAVSIPNIVCGRQLFEEDVLYSEILENQFIELKNLKKYLKADEIEVLKEIAAIKRKENPVWGV
ncbi:MAG TPA: translation initiation factor IF-2 [Candidatus Nanoarchaeia archaeon]|nr:translation initiation factor IF-2 [Candidatus Nanoarchaeia archaeon]